MALARVVSPKLVGRDEEISLLEDDLLSALRGEGGAVVLGGEAGMGKSRLVHELSQLATRLGCTVMSGVCSEAELSLPYLPFLEAIGNYLATQELPALRERLGPAADELAQLFPQMGRLQPATGDPIQAKLRLFEAILLLLRDAAQQRGLLFIVEDLHWADPATRELVDYATRRLRSTRVLVLATYRTDELHRKHALLPTIQGWRRSGQAHLIEIGPLRAPGVKDMVMAIFDEPDLSDEFRDFMLQRSEGNPFVLEELLRDAIDRGDIFRTDTGWDRKAVHEMRMPRTVRDTILVRLANLSPDDVEVLSAASAIGLTFDLATLSGVTGKSEAAVLTALEACITNQLLEEADRVSGRYTFRHALTREAVYEDIIVPRRQQLHARIAEVLESRPGWKPVDLAHHLLMAGNYQQAVGMCVAAAEAAIAASAYRDAAALFERALPHVTDKVERARLMCRAGDAYWTNTEVANARSLLEQGIADLEAAGLGVEAAGHRILLGRCYWELNRPDLARQHFLRAKEVLEAAGPSEALAVAYIRLSGLAAFDQGGNAGLADALRAEAIVRQAGSSMALAWSWNFIALAKLQSGHVDEGFRYLEDSYQAALEGDFYFQKRNAIFNAAWTAVHIGYGRLAGQWLDRAAGMSNESWPTYIRALVTLYSGRVDEAVNFARLATQQAKDAGNDKNVWRGRVLLAHALAESLQAEEAAAELPPVSSRVEGQDTVYDLTARVRTSLAAGDLAAAFDNVRSILPSITDTGSPADAVAEAAESQPAWLHEFVNAMPNQGVEPPLPRAEVARGRLALVEGRLDDAVRILTAVEAHFRSEGLLLDAWHVGRALAQAEHHAGHAAEAADRIRHVIAEAETSGAHLAGKLARETASRLGVQIPSAVTQRELAIPPTVGVTGERMVSVLFADVRGYTELSGETAPARMVERIGSLQRWAAHEVARHNGIVDKFAGDAVMATFNVSGQSVDHALHALQAAIAIIDKAALVGLPVGAGIAVGPAVVGRLADSANVSVLGGVTNLAARLQAQAPGGAVVLSEEAYRRVREWIAERGSKVEPVELNLKGFDQPVAAYLLGTRAGIRA
jgi:class 3 adenylate cyclase/tetratricopeptide (TPR) repeat protein